MDAQLLHQGFIKLKQNEKKIESDIQLIHIFQTESKYASNTNYFEMFILPNGALFMSEAFLDEILGSGGLEALAFILLNNVAHVMKKHVRENIFSSQRYGDLKKQMFLFENQYTGFDALFIDYYTNTRFKIDQELQADLFALNIMKEMGFIQNFTGDQYRKTLKVIQDE